MPEHKMGNPAVVGLAGFGLTTLVLQFHNVGWIGIGPVIWLGLIFGGLAQMIAGLQEMKTGNNFGFCAFTSYGCFWIALVLILIGNHFKLYVSSENDIGWFLVAWTAFTVILWFGAIHISGALGLTFTLLLIGFALLDLAHFGFPELKVTAGYVLMGCAGTAWYIMAHLLFLDVLGRDVLPIGKPWLENPGKRHDHAGLLRLKQYEGNKDRTENCAESCRPCAKNCALCPRLAMESEQNPAFFGPF